MDSADNTPQEISRVPVSVSPVMTPAPSVDVQPIWIEPDMDFIRAVGKRTGVDFKKCIQCGTCSGTCTISPDRQSFPCKEMSWVAWGMKDRLLKDPDIWLCYQCNDCSIRCPRGARPGYVLGAVRQECVEHYAFPRFFGRWVNQPQCIPLLLGIPAALLALALILVDPMESALGISREVSEKIVFTYSSVFPHWLLNSLFGLILLLVISASTAGAVRFWRAICRSAMSNGAVVPAKSLFASIVATAKSIFSHEKFASCEKSSSRFWSHLCVFFGFLALCLVTIWVITASVNPLIRDNFIYPFSFWSPWKILANVGGLALLTGCLLMIQDRFRNSEKSGIGSYFDWAFITILVVVVLSGFATEVLHYVRLEPHRHVAYFAHLVVVSMLLMYLPYSKFAHIIYRTIALVHAEYTGRDNEIHPVPAAEKLNTEKVKEG